MSDARIAVTHSEVRPRHLDLFEYRPGTGKWNKVVKPACTAVHAFADGRWGPLARPQEPGFIGAGDGRLWWVLPGRGYLSVPEVRE